MPVNSKTTTARNGVFISYARSDGEKFANDLRERLEKEGIPLWQDRVGMEGGRDWWLQITEALDQVEFMTLVITPKALKSDTVRKEWRYARQQGVCVYPIKGAPDLDFESLPRWMRSAHFYDLDREWQKFVNDLNTRCQQKRVPFMVGDLPDSFVSRPREFDQLLKFLVNEQREEPVAITAALRGAGGYGKTTLAKALCHDERVQDAFDDGILWVTLGESPGDLTGRVEDLIVTLGDERPGFTTLDAAVNRLKELLADRDILIVIDDVWDRAHLSPFLQGGPRCARLITTRNLDTLPAGTAKVRVDAMQQDEARAMLGAGLNYEEELRSDLTKLAARLGEWPLLLQLVNSALRNRIDNDKQSPRDAVAWINKALDKRGLAYFDARNSNERHHAVVRTIGVSLDLLSEKERERFGELAIFPEDVEIPVGTLEKLWATTGGYDEFDTEELCSRLNRFSLLWNYDANLQRIRLHDVVRKFLIDQQGDRLPSVHAQLLNAHRLTAWSEMSAEEPYLWDHLAHHLVESDRSDELVAAVKDWRYLVAKTFMRQSLAVENDLLTAEKINPNDDSLRLLRSNFVNSGHLLNRCENRNEIETTLFCRLQHLEDLKSFTEDLKRNLKRPCIVPVNELPDLPHPLLVRTLSHPDEVFACAVSADGATIISACGESLKVWDRWSGAERLTLNGHKAEVLGCAVSSDGATIVSASADSTLKIWDGRTGTERFTLRGHLSRVNRCAVSADGLTIVSASYDKTLKVWDGRTGAERLTLRGHDKPVFSCAITGDGATIISASEDQSPKVWDARTGAERFTLIGHEELVTNCAVSADAGTIVTVSTDHTIKLWDGQTGSERLTIKGHDDWVFDCAVTADGATIISTSTDHVLKVWDGWSGAERFTLIGHTNALNACSVSADGATIVSASSDHTLKVWDGGSRFGLSRIWPVVKHDNGPQVDSCAVSADGTTIVWASDGMLKTWDTHSRTELLTLTNDDDWMIGCAVSADGSTIVSAGERLRVWDGRDGAVRFSINVGDGWIAGHAMSADGATIISCCNDELLVLDGLSGAIRLTLHPTSRVRGCAINADGTMIVSASDDGTLTILDGRSGIERFTLSGNIGVVSISADGATIVSRAAGETLKVWDGRSGAARFTLSGHVSAVSGCSVSADGATIVSASDDGTLKVWCGRSGECLSTLYVDGPLIGCACSADGEIIAAAGLRGIYFLRLLR